MTSIPSNLARVPTLLSSRLLLGSITRTTRSMLELQEQLATGKALNRPSDDVVGTSAVSVLDDTLERRDQRLRNLGEADALVNAIDGALNELNDSLVEAKSIGLSQIGVGSDASTRKNQAKVIDAMLRSMANLGNRELRGVYLFGGSAVAGEPLQGLLGGWQYVGQGPGMEADLGLGSSVPVTMAGEDAFGSLSARVEGFVDLDPALTMTTRLADLAGARGSGMALGEFSVTVNAVQTTVDVSDAETIGDVVARLTAAIQATDPGATVGIDPVDGGRLAITPSAGMTVTIADMGAAAVATDLGLDGTYPGGTTTSGGDLDPRVTELTPLSAMSGLSLPLGTIRVRNGSQVRDLDLSGANTVQDLMNAFQELRIGVRLEIAETGDRLNVKNELSGGSMSIEEIAGGSTATQLGIRSLHTTTLLADFNDGLGVGQVSGQVDPVSGTYDPALNTDFRVTLKDGRTFDVDIDGAQDVQDVLDLINGAAALAGIALVDFSAGLASDGNGITLTDNTVGTTTTVADLNGSPAAYDLGIRGSTASATLVGEDRATVAVNSVFAHLIALRDALEANDERGIEFATGMLDGDIDRAVEARADVGVRARRISEATLREEDLRVQDMSLRSQIQDLDMTEAAIRFSSLQQQLQAGYQTAAATSDLSLLDFLR